LTFPGLRIETGGTLGDGNGINGVRL